VECDTVQPGRPLSAFWRSLLPQLSGTWVGFYTTTQYHVTENNFIQQIGFSYLNFKQHFLEVLFLEEKMHLGEKEEI
jgi:hypothetical protein